MLEIITIPVTPFVQNCRLLIDSQVGPGCVLVDPGGDAELILSEIANRQLTLESIWLTHSHLDHCGAVSEILKHGRVDLMAHPDEEILRSKVEDLCTMYGIAGAKMKNCPEPTVYLKGEETLTFAGHFFRVLFTPGHSPGHLCFYCKESADLIAGDTLFQGSIGRTDLPGGDHRQLINSIRSEILSLPDQTKVLPGHGPDTTVGVEKRSNPFLT